MMSPLPDGSRCILAGSELSFAYGRHLHDATTSDVARGYLVHKMVLKMRNVRLDQSGMRGTSPFRLEREGGRGVGRSCAETQRVVDVNFSSCLS